MRATRNSCFLPLAAIVLWLSGPSSPAAQRKDYLTTLEADKIRDAETTSERIKLFVSFAADRLKKFQYEIARPSPDRRRSERLNDLLNAYTGCLDDATERVEEGLEKQEDIRNAVKELKNKAKEFLAYLEGLAAGGPEPRDIKENLDDAIEATEDALKDVEKAEKEMAPPPVRRKP